MSDNSNGYGPYGNGHRDMANQYLKQKIEQASAVEQVVMLYDGIIRFTTQAKAAIEAGDIQVRCNANQRSMQIVAYLVDMVNPTTGGDVAKKLFGIYNGLLKKMLEIDFNNDAQVCDELIAAVRMLRDATAQAVQSGMSTPAPAVAAGGTVVAAPKLDEALLQKLRNAVA